MFLFPLVEDGVHVEVGFDAAVAVDEAGAFECLAYGGVRFGEAEVDAFAEQRVAQVQQQFHAREVDGGDRPEVEDHQFHRIIIGVAELNRVS